MSTGGDATAATSAGGLAVYGGAGASEGGPRAVGPGLAVGMTQAEVYDRLNGWGTVSYTHSTPPTKRME